MKSDGMKIRQEKESNTLMPFKFSLDCDATAEIILVWSLAQVQLTTFRLLYVFVMSNFSQLFFFKKKKNIWIRLEADHWIIWKLKVQTFTFIRGEIHPFVCKVDSGHFLLMLLSDVLYAEMSMALLAFIRTPKFSMMTTSKEMEASPFLINPLLTINQVQWLSTH